MRGMDLLRMMDGWAMSVNTLEIKHHAHHTNVALSVADIASLRHVQLKFHVYPKQHLMHERVRLLNFGTEMQE